MRTKRHKGASFFFFADILGWSVREKKKSRRMPPFLSSSWLASRNICSEGEI